MAGGPPPEFFANVQLRPGEQVLGFLPNLLSLVIPIQTTRGVRMDDVKHEMVERATDLVVSDQRMVGYKFEEREAGLFGKQVHFFPRFGLNLEAVQEVRVKDLRLEVMGELTGMGLCTLYLVTHGTNMATGLAQWLEAARKQRLEKLQAANPRAATPMLQHERPPAGGWKAPPPAYPPPPPPSPPP